jgi:HAMP domain-containing protein
MRRFLVAVTAMVIVLILAIVAYNVIDASLTLNDRERIAEEQVLQEATKIVNLSIRELTGDSEGGSTLESVDFLKYLNVELLAQSMTDSKVLYGFITEFLAPLYGIDSILISVDGQAVASRLPEGVGVGDFPAPQPGEETRSLDRLGSKRGHFVAWFLPMELGGAGAVITVVLDRTEEIDTIQGSFDQARRNLLIRQLVAGVIALVLALIIVLVGIRLLAGTYITGPIRQLSETARGIVEGTFTGKVEVTPDSDYAEIQSLLQSGQAIITRVEREIEQGSDDEA